MDVRSLQISISLTLRCQLLENFRASTVNLWIVRDFFCGVYLELSPPYGIAVFLRYTRTCIGFYLLILSWILVLACALFLKCTLVLHALILISLFWSIPPTRLSGGPNGPRVTGGLEAHWLSIKFVLRHCTFTLAIVIFSDLGFLLIGISLSCNLLVVLTWELQMLGVTVWFNLTFADNIVAKSGVNAA